MKRLTILALMLALLCSLCSCVTVKKSIKLSSNQDAIQSIEIYDITSDYNEGNVSALRSQNTPAYIVSDDRHADFLEKLLSLEFEEEKVFFPMPMDGGCDYSGYVISIVYSDGSYDIIAQEGQFSYSIGDDGEGRYKYKHADYCGDIAWIDFIEEYIEK